MAMQRQFQVKVFCILDFYDRCYQGENLSGTGWLPLKDLKLLYIIRQKKNLKIPVHIMRTSKQSNLNALINHTL